MSQHSAFDLVTTQHRQASLLTRRELNVEFPPARLLARSCNSIFGLLERDEDEQREVLRLAWRLKLTVLQTMLPFDDERLGLSQLANQLIAFADGMPGISDQVATISTVVPALMKQPRNPKAERVAAVLGSTNGEVACAILAGLQGATSAGWPADLDAGRDLALPGVMLIRSRRDLRDRVFSQVVVPGTLRYAVRPFAYDLLHGGRAREVLVAGYAGESIYLPEPLELPRDKTFSSARAARRTEKEVVEAPLVEPLDQWVNDSFWAEVRAQHPEMIPLSDRDTPATARFTLFADGSGAFLPEDRTIVEVSDLVDRHEHLDGVADLLPRKHVRDLDEGDLVLLRLSGSGDYLDEVADSLMARDGVPELRSGATAWKSLLYSTLKRHGEGVISRLLKARGGQIRSASYLWVWAGDAVMAPQAFDTFLLLIQTLAELEATHGPQEPGAYANAKWSQMELVKEYQQRAGGEIRRALLERVRLLLAERRRIETTASIDLPGVKSGRMGLLRVSAVDSQSIRVPFSRLYQLHPVRAN